MKIEDEDEASIDTILYMDKKDKFNINKSVTWQLQKKTKECILNYFGLVVHNHSTPKHLYVT